MKVSHAFHKAGMFSAHGQALPACSMSLRSQSRVRRKMASGGSAQAGNEIVSKLPPVQRLKLVIITKANMQELSLFSCPGQEKTINDLFYHSLFIDYLPWRAVESTSNLCGMMNTPVAIMAQWRKNLWLAPVPSRRLGQGCLGNHCEACGSHWNCFQRGKALSPLYPIVMKII